MSIKYGTLVTYNVKLYMSCVAKNFKLFLVLSKKLFECSQHNKINNMFENSTVNMNCSFFKLYCEYLHYIDQWSSRCAPVYTSVHKNYFTVHKKICKMEKYFLNYTNFVFF